MGVRGTAVVLGALLALPAVSAVPASAAPRTLPRLTLNGHVLQQSQRLVVQGTQCPYVGLEPGYWAHLRAGGARDRQPDVWPHNGEDGRWRAEHVLATVPANRYTLKSVCFKGLHPDDPVYPDETVTVLPAAGARSDGPLTVSSRTARPGTALRVSGAGFTSHASVGVFWASTYVGTLRAGNSVSGTVTVPRDARPGTYRLLAQGLAPDGGDTARLRTLVTYVTVPGAARSAAAARATTPPPPAKPSTTAPAKPAATTAAPAAHPTKRLPSPAAVAPSAPAEATPAVVPASGRSPLLPVGAAGAVLLAAAGTFAARRRRPARSRGAASPG